MPRKRANLDEVTAPRTASTVPDKITKLELENERQGLLNEELRQLLGQRRRYAVTVFILVSVWLTLIFLILIAEGFGFRRFNLPEKVLIAAITSTTANVIALLVIVMKFIFPAHAVESPILGKVRASRRRAKRQPVDSN